MVGFMVGFYIPHKVKGYLFSSETRGQAPVSEQSTGTAQPAGGWAGHFRQAAALNLGGGTPLY